MVPARTLLPAIALLLAAPAALAEAPATEPAGSAETIGGHPESWWRERHEERVDALEQAEALVEACEETEAPRAYDGVGGYAIRGRDGRTRWVKVKRCDAERAEREAARGRLERFEERARRAGVPPGWLR